MNGAAKRLELSPGSSLLRDMKRSRGTVIAAVLLIAIFTLLNVLLPHMMGYRDIRFIVSSMGTLCLAAMGATIVIINKGFDLSVGSVISFVNVIVAFNMKDTQGSQLLWPLIGILIGGAIGAFNGFFVAYMRLQPVVVTLATMFIVQGATTLYAPSPGGTVPGAFMKVFNGDLVPGVFPFALAILIVVVLVWILIRRSRLGTGLYSVGSDEVAATANGIPVPRVKFLVYTIAGLFYGAAGLFMSGQMGNGQPLAGNQMILLVFAAVVLGGSSLAGGRGSAVGSIFGTGILILISNLLMVLRIPLLYAPISEGLILIVAITASSMSGKMRLAKLRGIGARKVAAKPRPVVPGGTSGEKEARRITEYRPRKNEELKGAWLQRWFIRNRGTVRMVLPVYVLLLVVLAATLAIYGHKVFTFNYLNSVLVLVVFLAVVSLGQGSVMISGGFDLSIPRIITISGVLLTGLCNGNNGSLIWAVPLILCVGTALGALNGLGIAAIGIPPVIMTLAMNSIVYGLILIYTRGGLLYGAVPPALINFIIGKSMGFPPVALFTLIWAVLATLLLSRTTFSRRLFAVGTSQVVARLSGVKVGRVLVFVYMLSGFCSALAGILLAAFTQQATLNMGNPYLLPTIAVVLVGGTLATGGRGHYLGIFGGALLFTALSTMVSGTTVPISLRDVILGFVILAAVLLTREKRY